MIVEVTRLKINGCNLSKLIKALVTL